MLKKRIMGVVVVKDGLAVQSIGFKRYLPIGVPEIVVQYLNTWGIDEIAVVDIDASRRQHLNIELVRLLSQSCQVPLAYGGGIQTADEMTRIVQAGADKVMINQTFLHNPSVISQGVELLGSQCVVVSLDVRNSDGKTQLFDYMSGSALPRSVIEAAREAEAKGAGEIFLNSVDRDGSKKGYDLAIARDVSAAVKIPVTLCGGVGEVSHFAEGLDVQNISAVAAANYFNYAEHSVALTKQSLVKEFGANLRHDTYFNYHGSSISPTGRLMKKSDPVLKEMLFEYHPKEII